MNVSGRLSHTDSAHFGVMAARMSNPQPGWELAGRYLEQEGVPAGFDEGQQTWADLAPMTQRIRRAQGFTPARPILIRTGSFLLSFKAEVEDNGVSIVNDDPRFPLLQGGGTTPEGYNVPPRPMRVPSPHVDAGMERVTRYLFGDE